VTAHRSRLRVRFSELDPYAHVNHAVYVVYFESGRVEAMSEVGVDLAQLREEGWQLVVVELSVRYRAPAVANDELVVETRLRELSGASSRWAQRVLRAGPEGADERATEEVLCRADIRIAVTDERGRPRRMPAELRSRLEQLRDPAVDGPGATRG
jgi:acyl-CoA thioester hydrolase